YYRALHNAPPLTVNPQLSQMATNWAHYLLANNFQKPIHSHNGFGENIYYGYLSNSGGADAVRAWYNEISLYNWNYPSYSEQTGHFTQLVWKSSTELGIGVARRGDIIYVVCNYNPSGNYENQFRTNVAYPNYVYRN
ncbi:uncharacterized protein, partial [Drosophila takahashii]|uniref:uncharacterized protein n=1 Tax=Drosophila takahashii TaxID=29030 RepID=UPI003899471C